MAAEDDDGGAFPNIDDAGGREKNGADSRAGSRAARSASEPNIAEIDMLLPGRCAWPPGRSRDIKDPPGVWVDCAREEYVCGGDGGGIWRFPNAGGADCSFGPVRRVQVSKCFFFNKKNTAKGFQDNRACPDRMSNEIHVSRQRRLHGALGAKSGAHQEIQDSHCCPEKYDALFRVVMAYDS